MIDSQRIKIIVEEKLASTGIFATDVSVKPGNKIVVLIDGDNYVTVDDCVSLSRTIESTLDRDQEDFELQVSSAGADQWMTLPRQFPKNTGKRLEVHLLSSEKHTGALIAADQEKITLAAEVKKGRKTVAGGNIEIFYRDIEKAKCILSFK